MYSNYQADSEFSPGRMQMKNRPQRQERSYEDSPQRDKKRTKRKPDYQDSRDAKRNYL